MPRLLLTLPQFPQDAASGAARSMRTIAKILKHGGWDVRMLGTTASEHGDPLSLEPSIASATGGSVVSRNGELLQFIDGEINCELLDLAAAGNGSDLCDRALYQLHQRVLTEFKPDIMLCYGGSEVSIKIRRRAIDAGSRVVFGLRNHSYMHPRAFEHVHAVLTPSQFLSDQYKNGIGLRSTPLPTPVDREETIAAERHPVFITFINPSPSKGVMLVARLAEELGTRRPDIPMLIVESRATSGALVAAGLLGGFDLRRHANLMISPGMVQPRDIFAVTRVLLVPSVWEEPSGRVVAEALTNGVPPMVSDRGGLRESCQGAGFVLPLPLDLQPQSREPVSKEAVEGWLSIIEKLVDDDKFYSDACQCALSAAKMYLPETLGPRYQQFFDCVIRGVGPLF